MSYTTQIADEIARRLESAIDHLPEGFHSSYRYTQTGNNLAHPVTWGILCRLMWDMDDVRQVAIDWRLNLGGGVKFQPDLVAVGADDELLFFVDYESPNSSDARIPVKDVDAFIAWRNQSGSNAPYIIVTTLPDRPTNEWELRYTAPRYWNEKFKGRQAEIQENPFRFWYDYYREQFSERDMRQIALVNIDCAQVHRAYP